MIESDNIQLCMTENGQTQTFLWSNLECVTLRSVDCLIYTSLFYDLDFGEKNITLSEDWEGVGRVVDKHLRKLPGFDGDTFLKAFRAQILGSFVLYKRE